MGQHGLTDNWQVNSQFTAELSMVTIKACLTVLKCWKVANLQFTLMSVNWPYLRNWVFELDEIKCIWWRTDRTNQITCILKQNMREIFFENKFFHRALFLALPVCNLSYQKVPKCCCQDIFYSICKIYKENIKKIKSHYSSYLQKNCIKFHKLF